MTEKSNDLSDKDKVTQEPEKNQEEGKMELSIPAETVDSEQNSDASTEASSEDKVEEQAVEANEEESVQSLQVQSPEASTELSEEEHDENHEEEEDHHEEDLDLTDLSKKQLVHLLREKISKGNILKLEKVVHEIKAAFDEFTNKEREEALEKFKSEGGVEDDFDFRPSEEEREFNKYYFEFRSQVSSIRKEAEKQKEKNLEAKTEILNRLRDLVDGEETTLSMNTIKSIQEEWKAIGPVPSAQNRSLWASYNALMDRFYDNRSIYFELKELDRKKNLETKLELCEKAEALKGLKDLKEAIKSLNELHEEFKHTGPVPREDQESVWQRFKAASDAVYDRRKDFYESQKEVFKKNQLEKEALIEKLATYSDFKADRIKDWNTKTKEILEIQKSWEKIGPVPRESGKEINKSFWAAFKQFFHNKNQFFKGLDEIRATNEAKAEELIKKAEELMESTDWQNTANALIKLQQDWKKLGPIPEKSRDGLYKRFKNACDSFFENRRSSNKQENSEFEANYKEKQDICQEIIEASKGSETSEEELTDLVNKFNEIGFVPRKNMKDIQAQFKEAVDTYLEKLGGDDFNREDFLFRLNLNRIQSDPNAVKTLNKKEHGIRKQISDLENNITLWKNNLEFFAASKTADKLKNQFDVKIQKAEEEIEKLKKKLSILREF
ncbi:DUF349 domain-containing protein [Algoriphagus sp. CAU 1675]|uniref:DUF349 domain-containing protein n=1 Tax=Algoriphagus sp. CAU 1675 TaxID=3032597 RepID=UPI0023DA4CEF|nr:DUF349 domain-containing protein [Algoriphagus sp. CAU 1675]MDF2157933.1 DUF349 domain-containing protein [Algoriphagus sp. CAU 1675]